VRRGDGQREPVLPEGLGHEFPGRGHFPDEADLGLVFEDHLDHRAAVGRPDRHPDPGIPLPEPADGAGQDVRGRDRAGRDEKIPCFGFAQAHHPVPGLLAEFQNPPRVIADHAALRGEREGPAAPMNKLRSQDVLEVADMLGERRLGEEHPLGRPAEAALLHEAHQGLELKQIDIFHVRPHGLPVP